jgi:hypothetical protein
VSNVSDIDRKASSLIKRPQRTSVFVRVTLSHRFNEAAVNLSIPWEDLVLAICGNPAVVITSKLSREKLLKLLCSSPPIQTSFQGFCLVLGLPVKAFSSLFKLSPHLLDV